MSLEDIARGWKEVARRLSLGQGCCNSKEMRVSICLHCDNDTVRPTSELTHDSEKTDGVLSLFVHASSSSSYLLADFSLMRTRVYDEFDNDGSPNWRLTLTCKCKAAKSSAFLGTYSSCLLRV